MPAQSARRAAGPARLEFVECVFDAFFEEGGESLRPDPLAGISRVVLRRLVLQRGDIFHTRIITEGDDLFGLSRDCDWDWEMFPPSGTVESADVDFYFAGVARPCRVRLTEEGIECEHAEHTARVYDYLLRRGFVRARAVSEMQPELFAASVSVTGTARVVGSGGVRPHSMYSGGLIQRQRGMGSGSAGWGR